MDIIYHRNCLDGVFSAHLFYLASRVLTNQHIDSFQSQFLNRIESKKNFQSIQKTQQYENVIDLTPEVLVSWQNQGIVEQQKQLQSKTHPINQDFFHQPNMGVSYCAYSIFAGEFIPLKFPSKSKILFILDTNLVSAQNISCISEKYEIVFLIDHHTSFEPIKKDILLQKTKFRKLFYVFSENHCAAQLSYLFLQKFFNLSAFFQPSHFSNLKQMLSYISNQFCLQKGSNDRKQKETKQSKTFVLGFYYFGLELSHLNPLLNKRIGMINLDYLMQRAKDLYATHLKQIAAQIGKSMICKLEMSGKLNGAKCYFVQPSNPSKISDIGVVLAYLSKAHGMQNLALLYMQNNDQVRMSARSNKSFGGPLALELAQKYQGGGHLCAAGFKISVHKFKSQFTKIPSDKTKLNISAQQVENILLYEETHTQ